MDLNWSDEQMETAEQWAKDNAELIADFADACDDFVTYATELMRLGEDMYESEPFDGQGSSFVFLMAAIEQLTELLVNQGPVYRSILEKGFRTTMEEASLSRFFQDKTN